MMSSILYERLMYVNLDHVCTDFIFPCHFAMPQKIILNPLDIYLFKVNTSF